MEKKNIILIAVVIIAIVAVAAAIFWKVLFQETLNWQITLQITCNHMKIKNTISHTTFQQLTIQLL